MAMPVIVLRPEPGNAATCGRLIAAGLSPLAVPVFAVSPREWACTVADEFDGLLLTSANAARMAGPALAAVQHLPAYCVGAKTGEAAAAAGLAVAAIGSGGVAELLPVIAANQVRRLLWLAGEERTSIVPPPGISITPVTVYGAQPAACDAGVFAQAAVVLVHSARAAQRLIELAPDRGLLSLVCISQAVADAVGGGWRAVHVAAAADDEEMVAIAAKLCHEAQQ